VHGWLAIGAIMAAMFVTILVVAWIEDGSDEKGADQ